MSAVPRNYASLRRKHLDPAAVITRPSELSGNPGGLPRLLSQVHPYIERNPLLLDIPPSLAGEYDPRRFAATQFADLQPVPTAEATNAKYSIIATAGGVHMSELMTGLPKV